MRYYQSVMIVEPDTHWVCKLEKIWNAQSGMMFAEAVLFSELIHTLIALRQLVVVLRTILHTHRMLL